MNFFNPAINTIEYRDPLFGVVVLIFCIGLVSLVGYYWNYIISKRQQKSLSKFIESFDYIGFDKEIKEFLALSPNPIPSLLFMANMYQKSANYDKAIRLYATLLDSIQSPLDKIPILESLGSVYAKAGFPQRAKEIYLEILHHYPRYPIVLQALIKIYEELNAFKDALDALDCLEELQGGTTLHKHYLQTKILISSAKTNEDTLKKLLYLLKKEPSLTRLILRFLLEFYPAKFWQYCLTLPKESLLEIQDLLWNLSSLPNEVLHNFANAQTQNHRILRDIFEAKGFLPITPTKKATFELEALCLLHTHQSFRGDLRFNYQCKSCLATSPLPFERCPHCKALLSAKTLIFLKEKQDEMCYSFL